jgi:hypothetical protein
VITVRASGPYRERKPVDSLWHPAVARPTVEEAQSDLDQSVRPGAFWRNRVRHGALARIAALSPFVFRLGIEYRDTHRFASSQH